MSYPYIAQPSFTLFILTPLSGPQISAYGEPYPVLRPDYFATQDVTLPHLQKFSLDVAQRLALDNPGGALTAHRSDLIGRLSDAVKLVAAQFLRDDARCAASFRVGLLQAPAAARVAVMA